MLGFRPLFQNRKEAGRKLAGPLADYRGRPNTLVVALPRGGVPVAAEVAKALALPMDLWLVRKLGVPGHEELAMGAIAFGGTCHINQDVVRYLDISPEAIAQEIASEQKTLRERNQRYRHGAPLPEVEGKTIIIVDDGLATGATMRAAILSLRDSGAKRIIAAAPAGSTDTCSTLKSMADEVVCLHTPEPFYGVGQWYADFTQVDDLEVEALLALNHPENREKRNARKHAG